MFPKISLYIEYVIPFSFGLYKKINFNSKPLKYICIRHSRGACVWVRVWIKCLTEYINQKTYAPTVEIFQKCLLTDQKHCG